jgi:predicted Holliday junction resolvase-like endonuclease
LIKNLKDSNLYAECSCGEEFKLSDAILFDGTKPFPAEALGTQSELNTLLETRNGELAKNKKLATEVAERTTTAVNIGKNLERALPTLKGFKWVVPDSKFLSDPIDLLIFNGLSDGKVDSLSFVEVKSGKARLNSHQKSIRDAIEDHKVSYKVFV